MEKINTDYKRLISSLFSCDISNTRDSVSSGYPNTEKRAENTAWQRGIFDDISSVWMACETHVNLPFTQKSRLVDSCRKWDASNTNWKFSRGCARSISTTFSWKIGSKPNRPELVKTSKWNENSEFPFGNFGVPFKKSRFPKKISVRGDKIHLSIYIPSENSGFFG